MTMTTTRPIATTTYPFAATTYTNLSPSIPSSYPTTYTDTTWLPPISADTQCASATAYPSIEGPLGLQAACVISNAAEINPNAFWDVYECCPGHDMVSYGYSYRGDEVGSPGICMLQCYIDNNDGVTWQQVGECLQKRVEKVVCMPRYIERGDNDTSTGRSTQTGGTVAATRSGTSSAASGTGQSVSAAGSTGAAASLDVVHVSSSKLGLCMVVVLAIGSVAGLFL